MKPVIVLLAIVALAYAADWNMKVARPEIIEKVNSANLGWTAGVNTKFADMTIAQAKRMMGALPESAHLVGDAVDHQLVQDIPESFDGRKQWPECPTIGHVRDQASCGSCWAFGAAEAWSDRVCIATQGKFNSPLSTQDLLTCCGYSCGSGCNGGYLSGAWGYIKSYGLVTGGDYKDMSTCSPYTIEPCQHHVNGTRPPCHDEPTPACKKQCVNGASWEEDKKKASRVYSVTGEARMQSEIMTYGSIEIAMTVYEDFLNYKSGVYSHHTGSYLGGHAMACVGWGVENGQKYWIIKNSWNNDWGFGGYIHIKRGSNECGIEGQGYAGVL